MHLFSCPLCLDSFYSKLLIIIFYKPFLTYTLTSPVLAAAPDNSISSIYVLLIFYVHTIFLYSSLLLPTWNSLYFSYILSILILISLYIALMLRFFLRYNNSLFLLFFIYIFINLPVLAAAPDNPITSFFYFSCLTSPL